MINVVATNYTQEQFDDIICSLNCCYANAAYNYSKARALGLPCTNECLVNRLFLYRWVLNSWEQNINGTTTGYYNYINQKDLTAIIEDVKKLCNMC